MNKPDDPALKDYYQAAETWTEDRREGGERSRKIAWIVAGLAGAIALFEAIALVLLLPLKQVEPVAVLVDKQTGFVQQLSLTKDQAIVPDKALVQSMLAQYVSAREGFNTAALKEDYRKVALWSSGDARSQYIAGMQASNPISPLATLPRSAVVAVEIRSISPLSADSALVRFATARTDQGGVPQPQGIWAAVIRYRFTSAQMSAESRLVNPLGFQVLSYTKSAEIMPAMVQPAPLPLPGSQPPSAVITPVASAPTQTPPPR
jgi:type IV secretion system protein VirB8